MGRRVVLAAILSLVAFEFSGCASVPRKGDPRLQAELSRTLGVPQAEFRWVAAVDWSRHEGWWQPSIGVDLFRGTVGLFLGEATSTGVLTDDALVIARSGSFSVTYSVLQRIALNDIERVTLLDDGIVVLKRHASGEVRDYVRVLSTDPWLADQFLDSPSLELAQELTRQLQARVRPTPSRWRPESQAHDSGRTVALLTPRAAPVVSFPPPPGSADKGAVAGTSEVAKELFGWGMALGTLSPSAGLPFGIAAIVTQAAGSLAGAAQGTLHEMSEPEARAARARLEAVQRAGLPSAESSVVAHRMLLEALAARIAPSEAVGAVDDGSMLLVPIDEAETGTPDIASARAALAEDGFAFVWQLQVTTIEFRVVTAGGEGPIADPQVLMRIGARLQKTRAGAAPDNAMGANVTELEDVGGAVALKEWALDGGKRLHTEFRAACERLAARLVDGEMAHSNWLIRPR
jgi:hypothetical protein